MKALLPKASILFSVGCVYADFYFVQAKIKSVLMRVCSFLCASWMSHRRH